MQPDNLLSLKDDMVAFIAGHGLGRFNGYITDEVPTVVFEEEHPDSWKDFVEHAKAAGAAFLVMNEVTLEKADLAALLEQMRELEPLGEDSAELDEAEYLVNYVGKLGYIQLGFAHQGVMFVFEAATEWYDRFQDLVDSVTDFGSIRGMLVDDHDEDDD
ncbi:MAG: hypothetical protein KGK08_11400 [Acidobacteriota bacterium]|nr:hypothetical protein [Acidobacteriota bacterium]